MVRRIVAFLAVLAVISVLFCAWLATRPSPYHITQSTGPVANPDQEHAAEQNLKNALSPVVVTTPSASAYTPSKQGSESSPSLPSPTLSGPVTIQVRDSDINTVIASNKEVVAATAQRGISNVHVTFVGQDQVALSATFSQQGHAADITLVGSLEPESPSGLVFHCHQALVGTLPVPLAVSEKPVEAINEFLAQGVQHLSMNITTVSVAPGVLSVTGTRRSLR